MMKNILFVIVIALGLSPAMAAAQSSDVITYQRKAARQAEIGSQVERPRLQSLVLPSSQTDLRAYFGYRLILGGVYYPSAFPTETWINVACLSHDPRVAWNTETFGFDLVRVHAIIYELNTDGSLNTNTKISTVDTEESDEAICDLSWGVDASFIEIHGPLRRLSYR